MTTDTAANLFAVAPRAGAWIETIPPRPAAGVGSMSRPVRARGLKPYCSCCCCLRMPVAPRAGAWIETSMVPKVQRASNVAPRAGAWIETMRSCGLTQSSWVAPRAGAWIETAGGIVGPCL